MARVSANPNQSGNRVRRWKTPNGDSQTVRAVSPQPGILDAAPIEQWILGLPIESTATLPLSRAKAPHGPEPIKTRFPTAVCTGNDVQVLQRNDDVPQRAVVRYGNSGQHGTIVFLSPMETGTDRIQEK